MPTSPCWGYRVTQGLHVTTGTAAIPLLLVKLWTVYPKLFEPCRAAARAAGARPALERGSIAVLVAASVFQLATGLPTSPSGTRGRFCFRTTHYALAWVAIGALLVHIAVKLPVIRDALTADIDDTTHDRPTATGRAADAPRPAAPGCAAAGVAVLTTAGSTVPLAAQGLGLRVRAGEGPQGIPINQTARAAAG